MSEVGALIIKLQAETAQFREDMGKVKGDLAGLKDGTESAGKSMGSSMMEAKGSMMLLGEEVGVRIPRHLQTLIAQIPGVGAAFATMLPLIGVVAAIALIDKIGEKIQEARDKVANFGTIWAESTSTAVSKTGALDIEVLKLRDETAKLYGKPAMNGPAIAAIEALDKIINLDKGIVTAIADMEKLMKEQSIGTFDSLLTGKAGTADIESALKPKMDAVKNTYAEVLNAESQLELDTISNAGKAAIAADKAKVASAKSVAKAALDAVTTEASEQQKALDARIAGEVKAAGFIDGSREEQQAFLAKQTAQFKAQQSDAQQLVTSVQQQTAALQIQLGLETQLAQATKEQAAAQGAHDQKERQADLLKSSQEIMKAFNATEKLGQEYDQLQQHISAVNFKMLAEDGERAAQAEDKMLKSGESVAKSFQDIAKAQNTASSDDAMAALEQKAEAYKKLAADGLISERKLAEDLKPLYQAETDAKIAAVQKEIDAQKTIESTARAAGETVVANQAVAREIELQHKLAQIRQQGVAQQAALDIKQGADFQKMATQMTTSFNSAVTTWIVKGGSFKSAMKTIGEQVLTDAINYAIKETIAKEEQWAIQKVMKLIFGTSDTPSIIATNKLEATAAAGLAGANMMATASLAPWPIDMAAPGLAAAAFSTAMGMAAFEQGGKIPGAGAVPILGHGGETVVTKALTDRVEKSEGKDSMSRGDLHLHANFAPHIHAVDAEGVDRMLTKHSTVFQRHITSTLRRMNK